MSRQAIYCLIRVLVMMNRQPHRFILRVYYEDTDFTGLVYHANYLRFAERGRSEYLRSLGITHRALLSRAPPLAFVVRRLAADFYAPARVEDELAVSSRLTAARGARLQMTQEIMRDETLLWRGVVDLALIQAGVQAGGAARPVRLPADLLAVFEGSI